MELSHPAPHSCYKVHICVCVVPCSPAERSSEDTELIYDELLHVRAFRHLSNAVSYSQQSEAHCEPLMNASVPHPAG